MTFVYLFELKYKDKYHTNFAMSIKIQFLKRSVPFGIQIVTSLTALKTTFLQNKIKKERVPVINKVFNLPFYFM